MTQYNEQVHGNLHGKWENILDKVIRYKEISGRDERSDDLPADINEALTQQYDRYE